MELNLSKENIHPLWQIKKIVNQNISLPAQVDSNLQQQLVQEKEKFENKIRMYKGDDPLGVYYDYITSLEQCFLKTGRESNLILLLEDIFSKFKDNDKYKQDPRFVQLLIKYIDTQSNPLELYQFIYNQGLGTMCSVFYEAWAEEFEKNNNFKKANQVYLAGINCQAQPFNELQEAQLHFQLRIARRVLEGNSDNITQSKIAFSKLSSSKMINNRLNKDTAGIFQSISNIANFRNNNFITSKFRVSQETDFKNEIDKLSKRNVINQENMAMNKWCHQEQKQQQFMFKMTDVLSTSHFPIYEDPKFANEQLKSIMKPRRFKINKDKFKCPVAIFEPPDIRKKSMYAKQLVYVNGQDVQLEEIRASYYWNKIKKIEEQKTDEDNAVKSILKEQINLTTSHTVPENKVNNIYTTTKFSHYPVTVVASQSSPIVCTAHNPSRLSTIFVKSESLNCIESNAITLPVKFITKPIISTSKINKYIENRDNLNSNFINELHEESKENNYEKMNTNIFISKDREKIENTFKNFKFADDSYDFNFCNKSNASMFHHSPSTSITINTRTAMNVIQKMWESPLASKSENPDNSRDVQLSSIKNNFQNVKLDKIEMPLCYTNKEHSCEKIDDLLNIPFRKPRIISKYLEDNDDKDKEELASSMDLLKVENEKNESRIPLPFIVPMNLQDTPLELENKENIPPKEYSISLERRPLSGILTPATNVPLEEIESEESDDGDDSENFMIYNSDHLNDDIYSAKTFAFTLPSSTPFLQENTRAPRKSLLYNGSFISENNFILSDVTSNQKALSTNQVLENSKKNQNEILNLSLILENSKEQGSSLLGNSDNIVSRHVP